LIVTLTVLSIIILFFFLITRVPSFFQLRTLNLHMSRLSTFKAYDFVVFLFVFLFKYFFFSSDGMLKNFLLFDHLLEFLGHESHFIICGFFRTIV